MRVFKLKNRFDWKYILGEVLLIFIGINLAIWFNNWNTQQQNNQARDVAIEKIKGEISNNSKELEVSFNNAQQVADAIHTLKPLFRGNTSVLEVSSEQMKEIHRRFPGFYLVKDSSSVDNGKFRYTGALYLQLELIELSDIAWETTKALEVLNEFGYECLYDLEGMYSLQNRVQKEIDKAAETLQNSDLNTLLKVLNFMEQLEEQLSKDYQKMMTQIDNCK